MKPPRRGLAGLAACLGLGLGLGLVPAPALAAELALTVTGVEPGAPVVVALCQGGFGDGQCRTAWRDEAPAGPASTGRVTVPAGRYAVTAFQDANRNGRLDTLLGVPVERYGVSREVGRLAPPRFEAAAIVVPRTGTSVRIRLARAGPF